MATAAELKARLLKYAKPNAEQRQVESRSSELPAAEATERGTSVPGDAPVVPINGAGATVEPLGTAGDSGTSLPVQSDKSAVARTVETGTAVVTDLQPTTLVVVERPVPESNREAVASLESDVSGGTNLDITNPVHQEFLQRLNDVEAAMLARDPLMKTHLGAIHKAMLQYEEIANLLRPEEIAKIMAAQQAHTGIVLRAETVGKSKAAASKKAAQLGLNDV